ncbi:hypothetical protein AWC38_SpisGene21974 [Stylophora pistillata]|uniref:Uncharacterized protein n=1 Tax=Stylophora pistillata TaxID=50429 RepID=A0A2B4RAS1_STYPI|nr:hypothetical protein AWC38_SpisGene21974 [Stylophora pistillata]
MWLWLRPPLLPRPLSGIIVGAMYFPEAPADLQQALVSYIIECIDSVKCPNPDCGVVLLGDFNSLDVTNILTNHTLKQLVREPTRGNNILDLVISNLASSYNKPTVSAHLGSSDHRSVYWAPNSNYGSNILGAKKKMVKMRRFPESAIDAFGRWVSAHSWFTHTWAVESLPVDSLASSFSDDLRKAINIFSAKSVKMHPTVKPWMSAEIKSLILEQQRAYHSGSSDRWRLLRNKVRIAICKRKKEFLAQKMTSLKTSDPRSWWSLSAHRVAQQNSNCLRTGKTGLDIIMPVKKSTIHARDAPWVSPEFKELVKLRRKAFSDRDVSLFHYYRNAVNRERKALRGRFYASKVNQLKNTKPSQWRNSVKRIAGMTPATDTDTVTSCLQIEGTEGLSEYNIANMINATFVEPLESFWRLEFVPTPEAETTLFTIPESAVFSALLKLNPRKAAGPDEIPNWLLKEYADILAYLVSSIINCSFAENRLPPAWKMADVVPIPKVKSVEDINKPLRPISLTLALSKIVEDFLVGLHIGHAVMEVTDPDQYVGIPKSSTLHALISMVHNWSNATDSSGAAVRVVLLDYRKAFDFIDHTLLMRKVFSLSIPRSVAYWVPDILTNRQQRVKLSRDCFSE